MTSTTTTALVPKFVRLLSTVHAAKKGGTITDVARSTAFSREHFPKTLAAVCSLSFGIGFCGMNRWQRKRQFEWERHQEQMEAQFYETHVAQKYPKVSRKHSLDKTSI